MTKNTFKNNKSDKSFYIGLFGLSWRVCSAKERKSFGYSNGPDVPAALSGSFTSFEDASADCAERNRQIFV